MFSYSSIYASKVGLQLREVLCRLSEPRQSENNGLMHGFEARGRKRGHPLAGRDSLA